MRRRLLLIGAIVVAAVLVAGGLWYFFVGSRGPQTFSAGELTVRTSSTAIGNDPSSIVADHGSGWRSAEQTTGAWVELSWSGERQLDRITIRRSTAAQEQPTAGYLTFSDGSRLLARLASSGSGTVLRFPPRTADSVRFTVTEAAKDATAIGITHFGLNEGAGSPAVVDPDGIASSHAKVTGSGSTSAGAWHVGTGDDAALRFSWSRPRTLTAITLAGAKGSAATIRQATLRFSDGSSVPIGGVPANPRLPTTVAFMARSVDWAELQVTQTSGSGALDLDRVAIAEPSAEPATIGVGPASAPSAPEASCMTPPASVPSSVGLIVTCPGTGASTGTSTRLDVSVADGYSQVTATPWPADPVAGAGLPQTEPVGKSHRTQIPLDLSSLPQGPMTVQVQATGPGRPTKTALFQLYSGRSTSADVASSSAARGRSLVFREEFNGPISTSRTGAGAQFASGKPTMTGADDFGDAVFVDPSSGHTTIDVVDHRYLRIRTAPLPSDLKDPQGWKRTHIGGLISSARTGGSGFSAQDAYFEARMATPATPGTWPAFWTISNPALVSQQKQVAEIDAMEAYGQNPLGVCESTHGYQNHQDHGSANCGNRFPNTRVAMQWHTYGADVSPSGITFTVDGRVVATAPQVVAGDQPMFWMVDLALGGGWPINMTSVQDRSVLYVDYVRVYE